MGSKKSETNRFASQGRSFFSRAWRPLLLMGVWVFLLTGWWGPPGIVQLLKLQRLSDQRKERLQVTREELLVARQEAANLESNPKAQVREIRRVLGYVSHDELIFDFSEGTY